MINNASSAQDLNITLVKYRSGLGVPGIMGPKLSDIIEITAAPEAKSAKVAKTEFDENSVETAKQEAQMSAENATSVLALIDNLILLPTQDAPGIPDVFGKNTVVLVRRGAQVVWAYNPGSGGCGAADPEEMAVSLSDDHKAKFGSIVDSLSQVSNASFQ
ncbi:hypothetical protein LPJ64_003564 [Coemansia asiatica]|uniref:Uncharacterized protein n=1 Tax=Coemansia asiatica TaxID=1052880 RepID=A0A9W8CJF6_9FUNG|nr:hypothetical protein LPJ64_003564 [Coemansia asiatica]